MAKRNEAKDCCWPAQLYYNQLETYVQNLSMKQLRDAQTEFRACSQKADAIRAAGGVGANAADVNSITYYPTIEVTFEGEDVYPAVQAEIARRATKAGA